METSPCVVFKPTIPQQAAGTRIDPAVSVPNATSANPAAIATADPLEDPPGIRVPHIEKGFRGVPKYSLMPEGETANSLRFAFPTICTFLSLAIARHGA